MLMIFKNLQLKNAWTGLLNFKFILSNTQNYMTKIYENRSQTKKMNF